jgi:hypothetical protein
MRRAKRRPNVRFDSGESTHLVAFLLRAGGPSLRFKLLEDKNFEVGDALE